MHGLRPAESQRHAALLELHLLHDPRRGARLHHCWKTDGWREEGEDEGGGQEVTLVSLQTAKCVLRCIMGFQEGDLCISGYN